MLWLGLYVLKGARFIVGGRHHGLCCLLSPFPILTLFPQKLDLACRHPPPHRPSTLPHTLDLLLFDRSTGLSPVVDSNFVASFLASLLCSTMHECTYRLALDLVFLGLYLLLFGGGLERHLDPTWICSTSDLDPYLNFGFRALLSRPYISSKLLFFHASQRDYH